MVVIRNKIVRAATLPTDVDEGIPLPDSVYAAHRTRQVCNAALDDSDALSAHSRKNDQQLMKEINDRVIAATSVSRPSPVLKRRSSVHRASPVRKPAVVPTSSVHAVTSLVSAVDLENDVNREVDLMMPATARALRSGSVPPSSTSSSAAAILAEYNADTGVHPAPVLNSVRVIKNGSPMLNGPVRYMSPDRLTTVKYVMKTPDSYSYYNYPQPSGGVSAADYAVRQARRDLDRIDQELRTDATFTPRASPVRTVRTYSTTGSGTRPLLRRSSSFSGPTSGSRVRSPSPSYSSIIGSPVINFSVTGSAVPYSYSSGCSNGVDPLLLHAEATAYTNSYPKEILTVKRTHDLGLTTPLSTTTTRVHVPALTYPTSVTQSHLTNDVEALIRSARTLPEVPSTRTYVSRPAVTSYHPPTEPQLSRGLPPIPKPQISTTRRHVREVLCKVKKDPHYFD